MKKFIFFRNDRLGDFLILTSIIKSIKKSFKDSHITVLCSSLNYNLVKKYKIIDKVFVYNKKVSFLKKISLFRKISNNSYYASFAVDGKSFSNICNFYIKAKYKLGLVYKYKLFNFWFSKPNFIYNYFIFDKLEFFTSRRDLDKIEHLPSKLSNLGNFFKLKLKPTDPYYFEIKANEEFDFKTYYLKNIKKRYILIHLDEKWNDISKIKNEFLSNLINLQKEINIKIVITSFNNKFKYFQNFKKNFLKLKLNKKFILIENSNLTFFERLIKHSVCSISCHSGFLVQIAGANSAKLIDIISKNDYKWYSCWKPKNTDHKFIFKSDYKKEFSINKIFKNLSSQIIRIKNS